ncbi:carboxypeptidase regulatory-like domain-containing protein [bacterium]|nr:carboxypeptidase regulatory-like domain-containing protein [bacterium]
MFRHCYVQLWSIRDILSAMFFSFILPNMSVLYGSDSYSEPSFHRTANLYEISGTITDVSNGLPVQNAKVTLLDQASRQALSIDIYTNENGIYNATVDIKQTNISQSYHKIPIAYRISGPHPNPVSSAGVRRLTVQYSTPDNRRMTPVMELYNILGKKVDFHGYLPNGIYLFRLRFSDDHFSETRKLVLPSGGLLDIYLRQMYENINNENMTKASSHNASVLNDSVEVFYTVEKEGYAYLKQLRPLFGGMNNVYDFELVASDEPVSAEIDASGGMIEHPGGVQVVFPEGAFSDPVTVSVAQTGLPFPLPDSVTAVSSAFSISTGGAKPKFSAKVSFIYDDQDPNADVIPGIYHWNWGEWLYAGGIAVDDTVYTYLRDFSTFLAGTADTKIYRLFRFRVTGSKHAMVYVWNYRLLHPGWDIPITWDAGIYCFTQPYEPVGGNTAWYPQGFYQFCADWFDTVYGFRHRYIGNDPPDWTYSLGEYTSLVIPPNVYVDTGIAGSLEGPCDCRTTQIIVSMMDLAGHWVGELPYPFGLANLSISDKTWIFDTAIGLLSYPIIQVDHENRAILFLDYDGDEYWRLEWSLVNANQFTMSAYLASSSWDAHPTIDQAMADHTAELSNVLFTRTEPITDMTGNWSGNLPAPWGSTDIKITNESWILTTSYDVTTFPVILSGAAGSYVILWDPDDEAYLKMTWNMINENRISLSIYDTHPTIEQALNDTAPEIEGIVFNRM